MKKLLLLLLPLISQTSKPIVASYDMGNELIWVETLSVPKSVYWNSNQNIYYGVKSFTPTNNIVYKFDSYRATNKVYHKERVDEKYRYVGSISLRERIFVHTNGQQYIGILEPIDDRIILCYDKKTFLNTSVIYPSTPTLYTNLEGEKFYRHGGSEGGYRLMPVEPNDYRYNTNLIEI